MTPDIDLDALTALLRAASTLGDRPWTWADLAADRELGRRAAFLLDAAPALLSALTATRAELEKVTAERDEADRLSEKLTLTIRAFPHADNAANIAHARAQRDDYQGRHVQAELLLAATERERDAARAELERARAEIERLKVERGEALLWSPWNDHDVLFEQWAKRRAGAGDGEQDTATRLPASCDKVDNGIPHPMHSWPQDGRRIVCLGRPAPASVQGAADGEAQA